MNWWSVFWSWEGWDDVYSGLIVNAVTAIFVFVPIWFKFLKSFLKERKQKRRYQKIQKREDIGSDIEANKHEEKHYENKKR